MEVLQRLQDAGGCLKIARMSVGCQKMMVSEAQTMYWQNTMNAEKNGNRGGQFLKQKPDGKCNRDVAIQHLQLGTELECLQLETG